MNLTPNTAAFLVFIFFSILLFPWSKASQEMGIGEYFMVFGAGFFIAGIIICLKSEDLKYSSNGLFWSVVTVLVYIPAFYLIAKTLPNPKTNIRIFAAITAAYPAGTAIISSVIEKKVPSLTEITFILVTIAGVVGLSLFVQPSES
ncbi:MAG: hypothetical protein HYT63_00155 [Candidatus Yanofskybacteria bacterium]|nr:hypothetical protein [Candidatus Yanofskybacteria bacterium]